MRIFVNNADTYLGKALTRELAKRSEGGLNRIFGTTVGSAEEAQKENKKLKRVISREDEKNRKKFIETILSCKVLVYDLFTATADDLQFAISALKQSPEDREVLTLLLISSVMVWAGTQANGELLRDADYERRTPTPGSKYEQWKDMEDLLMNTFSPEKTEETKVKCYVIGAGILYGEGEDVFSHVFKAAWLTEEQHPILAPGKNRIPTIHVRDLGRLVRQVGVQMTLSGDEEGRPPPYLLAVDQPPYEPPTPEPEPADELNEEGVVAGEGQHGEAAEEEIREVDPEVDPDTLEPVQGEDSAPASPVAQADDEAGGSQQEGSQKGGSVEVLSTADAGRPAPSTQAKLLQGIVDEFCEHFDHYEVPVVEGHELPPIEPAEGEEETEEAKQIRELRDVLSLNLNMEPSSVMLGSDFASVLEPPGWLCQQGLLSNIRTVAAEFCKERKLRSMRVIILGPPASGKSTLAASVAAHFNVPHMQFMPGDRVDEIAARLASRVCHYRGYVLDAPGLGPADVENLFTEQVEVKSEEDEEEGDAQAPPEEEEGAGEEETKKKFESKVIEDLCPEFVIVTQANEDFCRARWNHRGEGTLDDFQEAMSTYEANNLQEDGPTVNGFFQDTAKVGILNIPIAGKDEEDMFESVRIYMEKAGRPFNYLPTEEEVHDDILAKLDERRKEGVERAEAEAQDRHGDAEEEQRVAAELQDERLKIVEEHEEAQKQLQALSLRQYLMTYMVPHISEGLIEVCKVLPENPVDYLAAFLEQQADRMQTA